MNMENHGRITSARKSPYSSARALWQSYQQGLLVANQEELAKKVMNLAYEIFLSYFEGLFNMP
jgi:hypothetical protein